MVVVSEAGQWWHTTVSFVTFSQLMADLVMRVVDEQIDMYVRG